MRAHQFGLKTRTVESVSIGNGNSSPQMLGTFASIGRDFAAFCLSEPAPGASQCLAAFCTCPPDHELQGESAHERAANGVVQVRRLIKSYAAPPYFDRQRIAGTFATDLGEVVEPCSRPRPTPCPYPTRVRS